MTKEKTHRADSRSRSHLSGFTLIELLVVISIISLLVAILLPALAGARKTAMRVKCATQTRQIGFGHLMYANDYDGWFPGTHYVGQAGIGTADTVNQDPIQYYGNEEILICPDTQWLGNNPIGTHQYGPGYWGRVRTGYKLRWTSYRFTAAHGNNLTSSYTFYGLHRSSGGATPNDRKVSPGIPRLQMAGQTITDTRNGWVHYLHEPSEMPLTFDGRSTSGGTWYPFTSSTNARFTSNHGEMNGMNINFLDGHTTWADQSDTGQRFHISIYYGGDFYWN